MSDKNNKKSKLFLDVIFIFILPQVFLGILFHFFSSSFQSQISFKLYLFFRNIFIISIYIYSYLIIFRDAMKIGGICFRICKWVLYLYTMTSIFLTAFYNNTPYTLISYLTERYENLFVFPQINDPLYNAINYVITNNFLSN